MNVKKLIDPYSLILYLISYYYIFLAAVNDGFTGYILGVPFALFLVWEILLTKRRLYLKLVNVLILIFAIFLNVTDRSQMQFIYPIVGKSYKIKSEVDYSYGTFFINEIQIFDKQYSLYKDKIRFQLKKGDLLYIERQILSGNPDFGVDYTFEIKALAFSELNKYLINNLNEVKRILSNDYTKSFNKEKTAFYFGDKQKFYIDDHSLSELFESQNFNRRVHESNRFRTHLTFFSFNILFYAFVWFVCLILIKGRSIFLDEIGSKKNTKNSSEAK